MTDWYSVVRMEYHDSEYNLFAKKRRIQDKRNVSMISDDFINESLNSEIVNIIFAMKCFSCEKTP